MSVRERPTTVTIDEAERRQAFYASLHEDSRAEFIGGQVVKMPLVTMRQADVSWWVLSLLDKYVGRRDLGWVATSVLVQLERDDFEPTASFWRKQIADSFAGDHFYFPAPDLVVEVLSPTTKSIVRGAKLRAYAAAGVPEYWIIDSAAETVERYVLGGEAYGAPVVIDRAGTLTCKVIEGFTVPAAALFDGDLYFEALRKFIR